MDEEKVPSLPGIKSETLGFFVGASLPWGDPGLPMICGPISGVILFILMLIVAFAHLADDDSPIANSAWRWSFTLSTGMLVGSSLALRFGF